MNIDSSIWDYVVSDFVKTDTHILPAQGSFIVPLGEWGRLNQLMSEALKL